MTTVVDVLVNANTREALDDIAKGLDLDPNDFETKADIATAIIDAGYTPDTDDDDDDDDDDDAPAVVTNEQGDAIVDFATYADAEAQAKALGKGARVEPIGTAYHVATDSDE